MRSLVGFDPAVSRINPSSKQASSTLRVTSGEPSNTVNACIAPMPERAPTSFGNRLLVPVEQGKLLFKALNVIIGNIECLAHGAADSDLLLFRQLPLVGILAKCSSIGTSTIKIIIKYQFNYTFVTVAIDTATVITKFMSGAKFKVWMVGTFADIAVSLGSPNVFQ